ncbi:MULTISPECIES: hypothetical protein [Paenibacillus]|uniref:Uncharacterized protein n=1 Tax=Paenibacillus lautus TaxID=1401 RepID=A0A1R1B7M1_PAELA|nr:hypothetical protein [Paenibacillus lautus]OME96125.1 hypothetical protein BK123_00515 [Paenibacillus lautus]
MVWTPTDQRRGRIDSGKTIVVAFGAEFLPLSSSFRKFGDNSDWRNDTTAERLSHLSLPHPHGGGFWVGLDPHGPAERTYRFRKNDSGRLWSRNSSAVIIIPGISATTAIGGTIRPRSGFQMCAAVPCSLSRFLIP